MGQVMGDPEEDGGVTPTHKQSALHPPHGNRDRQSLAMPWASRYSAMARVYVHPCVIGDDCCFVHERGLAQRDPRGYSQLRQLARETGFRLQEDRRQKDLRVPANRRRRWALVLALALCFVSDGEVMAGEEHGANSARALWKATGTSVGTRSSSPVPIAVTRDWVGSSGLFDPVKGTRSPIQEAQPGAFEKIRRLLHSHYRAKPGDPDHIKGDIDRIAAYYSKFPDVLQLLSSLEGQAWHLRYGKDTWATKASGTRVRVNQATVVFDPRMAAQLRFNRACAGNGHCTASPADALLHEFLHVRTMLLDWQRFIDQGGMGGSLYPYAHEAEVINAENALY